MGALDCVTDRLKSAESTEVFTINMSVSNSCLSEPRRDVESQFSKTNSTSSKHSLWWTLALDIPPLVIVAILFTLFEFHILPSHKSGFFCKDPKLSHEFTGDTVTSAALASTVMLLPLPIIFVTEFLFLKTEDFQRPRWLQSLMNTLWLYRSYAYGFFLNVTIVEVMKLITGAPRPTFFAICNPNVTCQAGQYVSTFECTPSTKFSAWLQSDSYHSFPSGHTSLSVHCGLFLAWYLQRRAFCWSHRSIFTVPVLQLVLLSYSALCSLTRVTDHRHHWWDVLVGCVVGVVSALYAVLVLCKNFSTETPKTEAVKLEPSNIGLYYPENQQTIS